jgi:hypothetical protein
MLQPNFLAFIAEIQPELLLATIFKPSLLRETVDTNVFPEIPQMPSAKSPKITLKKPQAYLMMFRCVCKYSKMYVERLPNLRLKLSEKGTLEADEQFFRQFRCLSVFATPGWEFNQWLDALVEGTKQGLTVQCLAISASDRNLASLVSKLQSSSSMGIKKVEISFYGHAHSFRSSIECFKSLSTAVGSVSLDLKLFVPKELEMPENVYGCFEALASTANVVQLSMK